ncbi:SpoIIE family protein phosphatase [Actinospica sp. MGRD01-02]|uniref:protein-serine/threonine phosphatase n=1 Tax=Actinospica acidithermotolerans TaxID=2828514 RepID=A0A941IKS7_9ACTN|nr:SpoIIE family protein phosphatase [Actinospica acidithermotolerans]MBR7828388.1 SpoIIE family protein phosphatase [Actinospica acidithermotolerans]
MTERLSGETGTAEVVVDARGFVTHWNGPAERLLGYPADEIVGRPACGLLFERPAPEEVRRAAAENTERWSGPLALRHRDGGRVDVVAIAHHGSGKWRFVCPIGRDGDARPEDDDLARWAFDQLPACSVSLYDAELKYRRSNQAMRPVVGLPDETVRGLDIHDITTQPQTINLADGLRRALETGEPVHLESFQRTGGERRIHAWSVDFAPLKDPEGEVHGVALIAHDITEQFWARKRLVLLNDAASRIGSTLDLTRTAEELLEVTVPEFADFASVDLLTALDSDIELGDGELSGTVTLRRVTHRFAPGTLLPTVLGPGGVDSYPEFSPPARALASGAGVLRNAEDLEFVEWMRQDARRAAIIQGQGYHSMMAVPLRARGVTLGVAVFYRRSRQDRMERFGRDDLLLAEELAARAAVAIDNARRYTREREAALSLQRSLLPQRMPEQGAVEAVSRYVPAGARSGIGGDWFDVIPLSGARVALVVGDVVGHGVRASATMGRLRTAVRTLSDVDLPPDELLTSLDDLVLRLAAENAPASEGDEIGATCCYVVYDPVSRKCTMASAGHPLPIIVSPDGAAAAAAVSVGPPLGIGGLPFEAADVDLDEGSLLALFSNGLIDVPDHDVDAGYERLRRALARPGISLDQACDAAFGGLAGTRPKDDVALLIARTRALGAERVATWSIPSDPTAVALARKGVSRRLSEWDLDDLTYSAELIASELVTNAIRYASDPITLRLIYDRVLICEVSDASSTAPHLRRARDWEEGGRGLMLVAQMAHRWGTRHSLTGKTIWAEILAP